MPEAQAWTKAALRAAALARRDGLSPAVRERASGAITDRALAIVAGLRPRSIGAYLAFGSEVDPAGLVAAVHRQGGVVGLPRMIDAQTMRFLRHGPGAAVAR